jgi:thiol-disulfide isomerase/thioredoxin
MARVALLLAVYAAGLGVPFLATGLAFTRVARTLGWVKRHFTGLIIASAASMTFFGVVLVLDRLVWITRRLRAALDAVGLGRLLSLGVTRVEARGGTVTASPQQSPTASRRSASGASAAASGRARMGWWPRCSASPRSWSASPSSPRAGRHGTDTADASTDAEAWDLPAVQSDGRIRLADFRGTPVVVNFFASWCTSWDVELPGFARVSEDLEDEVQFVGVDALESGDPMLMPERHGITWSPLARDVGGRQGSGLHQALGGRGMPISAFYDAGGDLVRVDPGALDEATLGARLRDLFGVAA